MGPNTDHPDKTLVPQHGAFSPAIGFSWQVPWFGDGKTTVRGGFQRTYGKPGAPYTGGLLSGPGADASSSSAVYTVPFAGRAANLSDLPPRFLPLPGERNLRTWSIESARRSDALGTYALFDPDFRNPHSDNWTLTVARSLSRQSDSGSPRREHAGKGSVRLRRRFRNSGTYDINTVNVYHNPELFNALEVTRAGGNDPLFDQMLMGLNLNHGSGRIRGCGNTTAGRQRPAARFCAHPQGLSPPTSPTGITSA